MESLGDEPWDVVLCGTGLQQSLLALSLSRADKKRVLHLDPNDYYGQLEAALTLDDADAWVAAADDGGKKSKLISHASTWKHDEAEKLGLRNARQYALALAPQIIYTRSALLSQLVSSRAYRQVEFLSVGSFFVYEPSPDGSGSGQLSRIPSSREDVFSTQAISARAKRQLMKFLKFVIDYDSEEQRPTWQERGDETLSTFLKAQFGLDDGLQRYILALALTLDGKITVKSGLAIINRHLSSIGWFGPGFCAVYPKWGGGSEIAQVACRALAVGGGIYMLDTDMEEAAQEDEKKFSIPLSNGMTVQTSVLVSSQDDPAADALTMRRLVAVVNTTFPNLFEVVVEGAPIPAVAVISVSSGSSNELPVYAFVHSSDTGECPKGQSVIYLTTLAASDPQQRLDSALGILLTKVARASQSSEPAPAPECLYKLVYEQTGSSREAVIMSSPSSSSGEKLHFKFPSPSLELVFNDGMLDYVKEAWKKVVANMSEIGEVNEDDYMNFEDREGADNYEDDEVYE